VSATLHVPDPRMLAIVLAAVTAVLPGVFAIVRSDTPDMSYERRLPSALPVDSIYDDVQGYQKFFEDRLGWRREFIVARNKAAAAIGVSPSPLARLGRGNWLFNASGKSLLDRAGLVRFGDETVHRLQAEFKRRTEFWDPVLFPAGTREELDLSGASRRAIPRWGNGIRSNLSTPRRSRLGLQLRRSS
jgi:hypothetical protein